MPHGAAVPDGAAAFDPNAAASHDADPAAREVSAEEALAMADPSQIRRVPRYGRFAAAGALLGVVVCAFATALFAEPTQYLNLFGVFLVMSVVVGPFCALLASGIAVIAERRARNR